MTINCVSLNDKHVKCSDYKNIFFNTFFFEMFQNKNVKTRKLVFVVLVLQRIIQYTFINMVFFIFVDITLRESFVKGENDLNKTI